MQNTELRKECKLGTHALLTSTKYRVTILKWCAVTFRLQIFNSNVADGFSACGVHKKYCTPLEDLDLTILLIKENDVSGYKEIIKINLAVQLLIPAF